MVTGWDTAEPLWGTGRGVPAISRRSTRGEEEDGPRARRTAPQADVDGSGIEDRLCGSPRRRGAAPAAPLSEAAWNSRPTVQFIARLCLSVDAPVFFYGQNIRVAPCMVRVSRPGVPETSVGQATGSRVTVYCVDGDNTVRCMTRAER